MFRTFIGMKFSIFEGVRKFFMQFVEKDKLFSLEAYLAFEEASETRHELYQGNLIEMSGTTTIHNEIVGNIYMILRNFLKGADWKVYSENIKIGIGENDGDRYRSCWCCYFLRGRGRQGSERS